MDTTHRVGEKNIVKQQENARSSVKELHVAGWVILYKFSLGLVEFMLGVGMALFGQRALHYYHTLVSQQLSEDPQDILVRISANIVPHLLTHNTTLIVYLIVLGAAKLIGAVGLYYKKNWGVDILVVLTILLLPFQLFKLVTHPNMLDVFYMALGIFIALYLIEFKPHAWVSRFLAQWPRE
jgi:uncharacterized membrane protein